MTEAVVALVVVLLAGCGYLAYRYRSERGIESGISSFRRELRALAPRDQSGTAVTPDPRPRIMRDPAASADSPVPHEVAGESGDLGPEGDDPAGTDR